MLIVHNRYQRTGGEENIVDAEASLLRSGGHAVETLFFDNTEIAPRPTLGAGLRVAAKTVWSASAAARVKEAAQRHRADLVHFHNLYPLVSPAAYYAVKDLGIPVVQSLHNFRLLCPNSLFFRDGHVCEDCLERRVPWPAVVHSCYRGSRGASAAMAGMLTTHRLLRTWTRMVDMFIAGLTESARQKFIEQGIPADRLVLKPNFVPDPGAGAGDGGYALFVGRLAPEKGIDTLLSAWQQLKLPIPLKIVGDGPLASRVRDAAQRDSRIEWLGWNDPSAVAALLRRATFLVFPSVWYEGMPRTIVESFAVGTPVVASDLGAMRDMIRPHETGLHFCPGDAADLARAVQWALDHHRELASMRQAARAEYEANYTAARNYEQLMAVYAEVVGGSATIG